MGCPCACHINPAARHTKPCCRKCPTCKENIIFAVFPNHFANCKISPTPTTDTKTIIFKEKEIIKDVVITKTDTVSKLKTKSISKTIKKKKIKVKAKKNVKL